MFGSLSFTAHLLSRALPRGSVLAVWLLIAPCSCATQTPPASAVAPAPTGSAAVLTPGAAIETTAATGAVAGNAEIALLPAELDPAADKYLAPQYAYFDAKAPRARFLVVYLIGANNKPERGRTMGAWLGSMGFPVVVPGYANDYDIRALCMPPDTPDPDCHGKLRREALEGKDLSPHIAITPANSLETRIVRMIEAMAKRQPTVGWERYLAGDRPRWESIIVSGHSHGASTSGLIGKLRKVERVVMLSGPFDNRAGEPAAWTKLPSATPADRFWGFSHTQEEQYGGHIKNWSAMGLAALGPVVVVDDAGPPFGGSHQLVTSLPAANGGNPHGTTSAAKASPQLPDGRYRFEAVWRHVYGL